MKEVRSRVGEEREEGFRLYFFSYEMAVSDTHVYGGGFYLIKREGIKGERDGHRKKGDALSEVT